MPGKSAGNFRHTLGGATMGTAWQAVIHAPAGRDLSAVQAAMAAAVGQVDAQMSTYQAGSDVNRLSAAAPGVWIDLPRHLVAVLARGLQIGVQSGGAFDLGLGDAVAAWGFGPAPASETAIIAARGAARLPAQQVLELDVAGARALKHGAMRFDLNGIAKGYGVDRLAEVALSFGLTRALVSIDGELRALDGHPDGTPWAVAVELPDHDRHGPHAVVELVDAAIATSGDYRHRVQAGTRRLSHTMDPALGLPLLQSPASVSVLAPDCASADAWATAFMVLGEAKGMALAQALGLSVLFLTRDGTQIRAAGTDAFARDLAKQA